ncbi:hypothetical protein Tco_0218962 [Tanacetum coccineum]
MPWCSILKITFDLEAFSDSDYGGSNLDGKSTTGGCQFLRQRLISWQCKKQTIMATSTTEAEYVAAANCCAKGLTSPEQTATGKGISNPFMAIMVFQKPYVGFNSLVHSFRALSTLRCSGLRTASAAAKPCQGDSSEFYLITGRIPTVAAAGQRHVWACRSEGHYITWRQYFTTRMIKRFTVADDLKECSRITIKDKSKELCSKITTCRTMTVLEESKTTSQSQRSTHRTLRFKL